MQCKPCHNSPPTGRQHSVPWNTRVSGHAPRYDGRIFPGIDSLSSSSYYHDQHPNPYLEHYDSEQHHDSDQHPDPDLDHYPDQHSDRDQPHNFNSDQRPDPDKLMILINITILILMVITLQQSGQEERGSGTLSQPEKV